jgi:hypothetical protein
VQLEDQVGVAVGAAVFVLSGWLLLRTISSFRRAWSDAEILRAPAIARQTLRFSSAGEMALYLEGPRFGTWSQRCRFGCVDAATGVAVPIAPSFSGSGVRSRRYSRVQHGRLALPRPGDYVLEVAGLQPPDAPEYAVVFMRLFTGQLLRFILACVLLGMLLIGSLVQTILFIVL